MPLFLMRLHRDPSLLSMHTPASGSASVLVVFSGPVIPPTKASQWSIQLYGAIDGVSASLQLGALSRLFHK